MDVDIRDRSRKILRAELAEAASAYCAEHGFDAVTVDEIAHGIGISRATFFRYFRSKEDAVVAAARVGPVSIADHLRTAAPLAGTTATDAVRAAFEQATRATRERADVVRARIRMISTSPALRARMASRSAEQQAALEEVLLELVADPAEGRAVAAASIAAIDLAWALWAEEDGGDLQEVADRTFSLVLGAQNVRVMS